jgi:hypothetical protein
VAGGDRADRRARPAENRLAECHSFKDVNKVLSSTRYTVAWRAVGLAMASYEIARDYALEREQFRKPIASFQLVQDKLARMLADVTTMQLLCWRASTLAGDGRLTDGMASMAKLHCSSRARSVVADARDILGGDGILLEHDVARHFADMEAIFTFEHRLHPGADRGTRDHRHPGDLRRRKARVATRQLSGLHAAFLHGVDRSVSPGRRLSVGSTALQDVKRDQRPRTV